MKPAGASLKQKIGIRPEACARKARQQAEFGLPRSSAENIDVKASMETIFRGKERVGNRLNRKSIYPRIEDRFVLDHDNVGIVGGACGHGRHQRQRVVGDIAQSQAAELSPGKGVEKRGYEGGKKALPLSRDPLERRRPAACSVSCY